MSYDISYVLCLVSYVFHIAFAYVLIFRDAYVLMFCDLIFESNRRVARSCSITIKLHRVICSYSCSCSYPYSFLHLRNLHTYRRITHYQSIACNIIIIKIKSRRIAVLEMQLAYDMDLDSRAGLVDAIEVLASFERATVRANEPR